MKVCAPHSSGLFDFVDLSDGQIIRIEVQPRICGENGVVHAPGALVVMGLRPVAPADVHDRCAFREADLFFPIGASRSVNARGGGRDAS